MAVPPKPGTPLTEFDGTQLTSDELIETNQIENYFDEQIRLTPSRFRTAKFTYDRDEPLRPAMRRELERRYRNVGWSVVRVISTPGDTTLWLEP